MMTKKLIVVTAIAVLLVAASHATAEMFTYAGSVGPQTWEVDGNWAGDALELVDKYPGQTLIADNALLNVPLAGDLSIDISTPIQVATLSIGDTDGTPNMTTITGSGVGTLTAATINTVGTAGAVNSFDVDYLLKVSVTLAGGGTNPLTINGDIINNLPGANVFKDVRNDSGQTLTINGNVILSNAGSVNGGDVRFRQGADATQTVINGVISDGTVAGGQVNYARGIFHIKNVNTHTGTTQLGENSPNNASTNIIYTDSPFGTGRLVSSGGTAIKTIEGAAGLGTRTLANEIQLARELRLAGSESIVLSGQVFQTSSRSLINDISGAGKMLSVTGNVFTDSGTNAADLGRKLTFAGSGRTEVSGVIEDKLLAPNLPVPAANRGNVRQSGTGRTVFMNNSVVAYGQATEVYSGTLQLGTGGAPVNLNGHSAPGAPAGTGTLEINHSGVMNFDSSLGYKLTVNHEGTGTTDFSDVSFGTGSINVNAGTVVINGGMFAGSALASTRDPGATGNTAIMGSLSSTAGLHVGQPISGTPVSGTGTFVVDAYIAEIINATTILVSGNVPNVTGGPHDWNLTFGAGTGTGTANVIVGALGTVGGNGVIGGTLGASGTVAPGASIGTLSVLGNSVIDGGFDVEYDGAGAGSVDLLDVSGNLTIGANSTVDFDQFGAPADDVYVFAKYGGTLTGTFGTVIDLPTGYFISYAYGGNSIALVPEPAALMLFLIGMVGPLAVARRRRA